MAFNPLSENPQSGLLLYLQDASSLGTSTEINDAYFENARRLFSKLSDEEQLEVVARASAHRYYRSER